MVGVGAKNFRASPTHPQLSTGFAFFPPSPPKAFGDWPMGSRIQLQQRNCSRFTRDFSRRSTDQARKELMPEVAACASPLKIYLSTHPQFLRLCVLKSDSFQSACNRRRRFHRLEPHAGVAGKISERAPDRDRRFSLRRFQEPRRLSRRFRRAKSGDARLAEQFGDEKFDAIFHLASITDTTNHDQFEQVHDNVESFRRILNFARPNKTRIVYASSASTYGAATEASVESNGAAPANVYAFSKRSWTTSRCARPANRPIGSSSACVTSMFTVRAKRTKACRRAWFIICRSR